MLEYLLKVDGPLGAATLVGILGQQMRLTMLMQMGLGSIAADLKGQHTITAQMPRFYAGGLLLEISYGLVRLCNR